MQSLNRDFPVNAPLLPNYGVRVDHDPVFLKEKVDIRVEALFAAFAQQDQNAAAGLQVLFEAVDLVLGELVPGGGQHEDFGALQGVERDEAVVAGARGHLEAGLEFAGEVFVVVVDAVELVFRRVE